MKLIIWRIGRILTPTCPLFQAGSSARIQQNITPAKFAFLSCAIETTNEIPVGLLLNPLVQRLNHPQGNSTASIWVWVQKIGKRQNGLPL